MNNTLTITLFIIIIFISLLLCLKKNTIDTFSSNSNVTITGNLVVNNNVEFTDINDNTKYFDILPSGTILPFLHTNIPMNWGLCDGSTYIYDSENEIWSIESYDQSESSLPSDNIVASISSTRVITPNLAGRCLIGAGTVVKSSVGNYLQQYSKYQFSKDYNFSMNEKGGEDAHLLTAPELAEHEHQVYNPYSGISNNSRSFADGTNNGCDGSVHPPEQAWYLASSGTNYPNVPTGAGLSHINMAPYIALQYIIKF
jgi:microcystin-dependent protein